jgi:putative endonuclease
MGKDNQQKGHHAEQLAADFLIQAGYTILERNWHCAYGEIDIIAKNDNTCVFIEVRARKTLDDAFASITPSKQEKMTRSAYSYLEQLPSNTLWRVDMIAVAWGSPPKIQHVEDVLGW